MMFFAPLKMMLLPLVAMMRCLPQCAVRHTSSGEAVIIGQSPHHLPQGKHHWKKHLRLQVLFSGGGWWIRTTEVSDNRFTVCPLWPLGKSPIWSWWSESNQQPADYKSAALPLSHTSIFWLSVESFFSSSRWRLWYYTTRKPVCQHFFEKNFDFF